MTFWDYEKHNVILRDLHQRLKLDDYQIAERMHFSLNTIKIYRQKLGLERNCNERKPTIAAEQNQPAPREKPSPLKVAFLHLGPRLVEKPSGYWLDGVPVNLDTIMQACNQVRVSLGLEQILNSEKWRI